MHDPNPSSSHSYIPSPNASRLQSDYDDVSSTPPSIEKKKKGGRGPTSLPHSWDDIKLKVEFNEHNQPIGENDQNWHIKWFEYEQNRANRTQLRTYRRCGKKGYLSLRAEPYLTTWDQHSFIDGLWLSTHLPPSSLLISYFDMCYSEYTYGYLLTYFSFV
ncbi:hypothetical protein ACJIZ3_008691 [Penstemon smallii]|uniref:Uncharacterized protein n=1 Tax=Penstemon smallii TaxID=265156 RepID=A0ABD3TB76_9LAMI